MFVKDAQNTANTVAQKIDVFALTDILSILKVSNAFKITSIMTMIILMVVHMDMIILMVAHMDMIILMVAHMDIIVDQTKSLSLEEVAIAIIEMDTLD